MSSDWPPDGRRVAHASQKDDSFDVFFERRPIGGARLTTDPGIDLFRYGTPDGRWISFHLSREREWHIFAKRLDDGKIVQLTFGSAASRSVHAWTAK